MSSSEVQFGLIPGSWHGAWCFEPLQEELDTLGYDSIAVDLPLEDPFATFDKLADEAIYALKANPETSKVIVGHSRAGNILPRIAGEILTQKMVFLCPGFEPKTLRPLENDVRHTLPKKHRDQFYEGLIEDDYGLIRMDTTTAKELLYHDCPPDIQDWATKQLRPQRRSANEPALEAWPASVPVEYIIAKDDRTINPEYSRYIARNILNVEPIEIEGGHSPFLAQPKKLARLLISLIGETDI